MLWQLWSHNRGGGPQGTFSHATALTLHELSDAMPRRLDMIVPPGFSGWRRFHRFSIFIAHGSATTISKPSRAVHVTTPLRTLVDVIDDGILGRDLQVQAVHEAIRRGRVTRRQLEAVKVSRRTRQRIDRILKQVPDGNSAPVRERKRVSRSA